MKYLGLLIAPLYSGIFFGSLYLVSVCCNRSVEQNNVSMLRTGINPFSSVSYVSNYDGDTITVDLPDTIPDVFSHEISVRIRHIDTPEITSKDKCEKDAAQKAKAVTNSLLKNAKKIDLEDVGRDKYFRLLCSVNIITQANENLDLSNYLMAEGYAVPYEGGTKPKTDWCKLLRKRKSSR
jgi:endonuclease YncB( thermonuclease family)